MFPARRYLSTSRRAALRWAPGRLYLNNNPRALEIFDKDPSGTITKAEHNWPSVKDKAL
jgi:hypothetical protein